MTSATPAYRTRPGAVSASTVFAIALAIVAGLIFAWLFRMVFLTNKKTPAPVDNSIALLVTTTNLYDKMTISARHVKTIKIPQAAYSKLVNESGGKPPLTGSQPVGRVTRKPILAETPIFEDDLEKFQYPPSLASILAPGKRPAIIEVGPRDAMVQTGDYVDLYVTMANDVFGPAGNATALLARNAKVMARFNTTRPGAQPAKPDAPRTYTLEVSPYRYALIELAKNIGAKFSLTVTIPPEEGGTAAASTDANEPSADLVTPADLADLFRIGPQGPPPPPPFQMERMDGLRVTGTQAFPGYHPPRVVPAAETSPGSPSLVPAVSPAPAGNRVAPAGGTPSNRQGNATPARRPQAALNARTSLALASSSNYGFRAAGSSPAGCVGAG